MFVKKIVKTDNKSKKQYNYFRLCESYRLNGKPRHRTIITLGKLEELASNEERKLLVNRIEEILTDTVNIFETNNNPHIERYAVHFAKEIEKRKLYDIHKKNVVEETPDYQHVDVNSLKVTQANEIGAEWLAFQAIRQLEMDKMLEEFGFSQKEMETAIAHVIARSVFPASEKRRLNG